tara:strand:- start:47 stop:172 length:126 start_codon:yes stop_codon:yes gene_type:complete
MPEEKNIFYKKGFFSSNIDDYDPQLSKMIDKNYIDNKIKLN